MFIAKIIVKNTGQVINSQVGTESSVTSWAKNEIFGRTLNLTYNVEREVGSVEHNKRIEENNDTKMEVEIINKENGEIVERYNDYKDEAIRWARKRIYGKPYLKYKTYQMQAE